jgi:hypothetical protein
MLFQPLRAWARALDLYGRSAGAAMWILKSAQSAFKSWTMILGMLIGGITLFNFLTDALNLGLKEVFRRILDAYHAVFHTLFDWFTFWIPFHFEPWMKDVAVLWFVLWGAMVRILWLVVRAEIEHAGTHSPEYSHCVPVLGEMMEHGGTPSIILAFILSIALWPLMLLVGALTAPCYFRYFTTGGEPYGLITGPWGFEDKAKFVFDIRGLYLIQIAMMVVVAVAAIVTNEIIN